MPTSANARTGWGLDGPTVAAQDARLQLAGSFLTGATSAGGGTTGIAARQGVRPGLTQPLLTTAISGMNVNVNSGTVFIQGTTVRNSGTYTVCLDTNATLTVSAANVTNPRIDNVIARVTDNGNNTSTSTVELTTGVAAPSPSAPALPANSLLLAQIAVAANASSITSANITDKRVFTAATGGIIPVKTSADQPQASSEFPVYRHRLDVTSGVSSPLEWSTNGTTWNPVATAPAMVKLGTVTLGSSAASMTVNISGTGYTGIMCTWYARTTNAAGGQVGLQLNGDSGANYGSQQVEGSGSTASATEAVAGTSIQAGYCAGANDPANAFTSGTINIPNAFNTSMHKAINATAAKGRVSGSIADFSGVYGGIWASTAAVTSVTLVHLISNLTAGSTLTVYGLT